MHMSVSINCKHINFYSDGNAVARSGSTDINSSVNLGCKEATGITSKHTQHMSGRMQRIG